MAFLFESGERVYEVAAVGAAETLRLSIDGVWHGAQLEALSDGAMCLRWGGREDRIYLVRVGDRAFVHLRGESFEVALREPIARLRAERAAAVGEVLCAPMPGVVVELRAPVGNAVRAGDTVLVIESMKLQTALAAQAPGRVAELPFAVGQSFDKGVALARIEPEAEEP